MATKKPAAKPAPPTPRPQTTPAPSRTLPSGQNKSTLDLVRNLGFGDAMAQQTYLNILKQVIDQRAATQNPELMPIDINRLKAPPNRELMPIVEDPASGIPPPLPTRDQNLAKSLDDYVAKTYPAQANQNLAKSLDDYVAKTYPAQANKLLANEGMGGGIPTPLPQNQQMQSYQNFLSQGKNNMSAINQNVAASFANTQPGMQATGSANQYTTRPAMPVAGMGAKRLGPTPRKLPPAARSFARFA